MNINKELFYIILSILLILYILPIKEQKILNRPIWHNPKKLIDYELDGNGTNQQLFDIYSFSHISHGILFYHFLNNINIPIVKKNSLLISLILEISFEIFENTPYTINKYRKKKEFENYNGDSIINIIGDILCTIIGYYLAQKSLKYSFIYLIISEILLIPLNANLLHLSIGSLILN
tara:strand:- start:266 stop:796 length:531 start_codon:yes stop_codon:yes gene_type:complete